MIRAALYLVASGVIWFAEGFIFSRFLGFSAGQTALLAILYLALFGVALAWLIRLSRDTAGEGVDLTHWRYLSLAPMLTVILGSFISLPIILAVLAVGKIA